MTPSTIIAQARTKTWVDSVNYPDAQGIIDFNFVYQDIISDIISEIDEDYFWNIIKTDSVINQEEYTIKRIASSDPFINEVNKVFVKYSSSDTYYTQATRVNPTTLDRDTDWYKLNQPKTSPIYYVQDNSVMIYPAPTEVVTNWIKMNIIYQPADLTISSTEADIVIPPRFHKNIIEWIVPYIYSYRWKLAESTNYMQIYDKKKKEMIGQMKNRNQGIIQIISPNLNQYT